MSNGMRLTLSATLALALSGAALAQDTSGGPDKSMAPNSLGGITSGSSTTGSSSPSNASSTNPKHADPGPVGSMTDGIGSAPASQAGGTPQGRNNTMDDAGVGSSGPAEAERR